MGKTWFITGASSGIGRHLTEQVLARGDSVFATARRVSALDDLAGRYPGTLRVVPLDVTDGEAVRHAVDAAFSEGRIDVIVSNAGYGLFGAIEEVTDAQITQQIETNLLGSIRLIRAALPRLRAQGGGRIQQVSSTGGQTVFPNFGIYHVTKWGIEGFIETLAQEVAPFGISCTIVEPGATPTGFGRSLVRPEPMPAYAGTPAATVRRALDAGEFPLPGDAAKMAQAMITCAEEEIAPLRLTLGSDSFRYIHAALKARLAALEAQEAVALAADHDAT